MAGEASANRATTWPRGESCVAICTSPVRAAVHWNRKRSQPKDRRSVDRKPIHYSGCAAIPFQYCHAMKTTSPVPQTNVDDRQSSSRNPTPWGTVYLYYGQPRAIRQPLLAPLYYSNSKTPPQAPLILKRTIQSRKMGGREKGRHLRPRLDQKVVVRKKYASWAG